MGEHSYLSPSSAHRWSRCPGAPEAEAQEPETSSKYADEGTAAHELAALVLATDFPIDRYRGRLLPVTAHVVDDEMVRHVGEYVDYVRALRGTKWVEQRLDLGEWVPDPKGTWGTADCVALHRRTLRVVDLKYGRGVPVSAGNNPQLVLYALGAMRLVEDILDVRQVVLVIHQPRLGSVSEVTLPVRTVLQRGRELREAAMRALAPAPPRIPGDWCRFCRAAATCPPLARVTQAVTTLELDTTATAADLPPPDALSDAQLAVALAYRPAIEGWLGAIEARVTARLLHGEAFVGWKLVRGRANRSWGDAEAAETALVAIHGDGAYEPRKLLSVAQAEKKVPKDRWEARLAPFVLRGVGKPTLVPESDKRPAIDPAELPAGEFADLTQSPEGDV